MKKILSFAFLFLFFGSNCVYSQFIPFDNYTIKEEVKRKRLPATFIYDIEQDQLGYIWLATQVGVIKYDGYTFTQYTTKDGLPDNNINDIFIDSKNRIWIATSVGGLAMLENNQMYLLNQEKGLVSDYAKEVLEDHTGNIWYFSFEGISIINSDTIINYNQLNSEIEGRIFATKLGIDGKVWFSTINTLFYYDTTLHKLEDAQLKNFTVHDITEDKPNSLWLATEGGGAIHLDEFGSVAYNKKKLLSSNVCLSIEAIAPDTVIVSTSNPGGVYRIINNTVDKKWENGIEDYYINGILADHHNRIWLSTPGNGLLLIENDELRQFKTENNLVSNQVVKSIEDYDGNIWFATGNGLSKYGKVIFQIYRDGFLDNNNYISSITEHNNTLYLGTLSGLNISKEGIIVDHFNLKEGPNPAPYSDIYSILPDNQNRLWLATTNGITKVKGNHSEFLSYADVAQSETEELTTDLVVLGNSIFCATSIGLIKYDQHNYYQYTVEDGLSDNGIWSLALDGWGNIWCATLNGLSIFDGENFHNYGMEEGLPDYYCNDITFDSYGNAWLATDNGISIISLNDDWTIQCKNINSAQGLKSDIVFSILIDKEGFVWMGHNAGLDRLNPSSGEFVHYGPLEGFIPVENSLGAATITSGNDIWFGTVSGAVKYIPENDFKFTDPPRIYIDSIQLFNDSTEIMEFSDGKAYNGKLPMNLSLPYHKNDLIFKYVGLHYTIIEKNRYRYKLEGYDNDWSKITSEIATPPYRKIPPGKYTFKVLASNCDGVWTKKPAEYSFEIRPPFWKTWWFYTLEALAFIFLLITFVRLRERKLRQDKEMLTQKVKERTLEVEKQRDQIADQKKEITDSIVYAERIQTAVLPKDDYIDSLLGEYFILFKPRDIVSGDFYWIHGKDDRVIVVAADCTGHGVPGAFMSMLGVSILNELASSPAVMNSDTILNTLREHLTKTLRQTGKDEDAKDGMDLALSIIDTKKMIAEFSGAYNPLVHIRAGECSVYKGDKMPVGIHFGTIKPFTSQIIKLEKGDCLYMFSDGYADQFGGPDDKKFKTANLRELLVNNYYLPMEEQKSILNETIEDWKGISEQVDDILVIGIRV